MRPLYVVQYLTDGVWLNCPDGYYENRNSANYHVFEANDPEFPDCVCTGTTRMQEIGVHI